MRAKDGDEAAIEEFFRRRRGQRYASGVRSQSNPIYSTPFPCGSVRKVLQGVVFRAPATPRGIVDSVVFEGTAQDAPPPAATLCFRHLLRVYGDASTKRGESGANSPAELLRKEGAKVAAGDRPRARSTEENGSGSSSEGVEEKL